MPNVQVRDVPEEVHAALVQRAKRSGQSLQQYLQGELVRLVTTPTNDELFDRIDAMSGGALSLENAVAIVRSDRDRR